MNQNSHVKLRAIKMLLESLSQEEIELLIARIMKERNSHVKAESKSPSV